MKSVVKINIGYMYVSLTLVCRADIRNDVEEKANPSRLKRKGPDPDTPKASLKNTLQIFINAIFPQRFFDQE